MTTLREAAQQALEALENGKRVRAGEGGTKYQPPLEDSAITALRDVLAQPEPMCVGCEGKPTLQNSPCAVCGKIAQQEQEPVAMLWKVRKALALASAICDRVPNRWHHTHEIGSAEADIGDMVNAHPDGTHGYRLIQEAEAELVAYLTTPEAAPQRQPEQEPVAWMYHGVRFDDTPHDSPSLIWRPEYMDAMSDNKGAKAVPLYTHPPRREWRGLTDEEVAQMWSPHPGGSVRRPILGWAKVRDFSHAVEAALKEKNHA